MTDTTPARTTPEAAGPSPGEAAAEVSSLRFDQALDELRTVVSRLETGGLPLEDSIALYERGASLHEHCARLLDTAEARIARLVDGGGAPRLMDLRPDDGDDA